MTNASTWIPVLTIVLAALWNQYSMAEFRKEMQARFERIETRMQEFGDKISEVKGRLEEISKHV